MLNRFRAIFIKETKVLARDRTGLLILYLMPLLLVLIMVFIQQRTFHFLQDVRVTLLFDDLDQNQISLELKNKLEALPQIDLKTEWDDSALTPRALQRLVASGEAQAGIIIPQGLTQCSRKILQTTASESDSVPGIQLYFDPALKPSIRNMLQSELNANLTRLELALVMNTLQSEIRALGPQAERFFKLPDPEIIHKGLFQFTISTPTGNNAQILPNAVQHNIPGWTLFAMFFIVIPLAGGMIQERTQGTFLRLRVLPVNSVELFAAKIIVYLLVCLSQFSLMLLLGMYVIPWMGLPQLQLGSHHFAMFMVALASAFAATGFGVLVGTFAKTHQQASSFGAIAVLMAAALGGIWVPVFIMPQLMQQLSRFSPMAWGLNAFHEIFLRNGTLLNVRQEIIMLLLFFLFTLTTALIKFKLDKN